MQGVCWALWATQATGDVQGDCLEEWAGSDPRCLLRPWGLSVPDPGGVGADTPRT